MINPLGAGLPVGWPGMVAMDVGGLAFFAAVVRVRLGAGKSGSIEKRAPISIIGIALQMLGFAVTGFGPMHLILPAAGPASVFEAITVAVLMTAAVSLFVASAKEMGRNWSLVARTRSDHELITGGPFARIRHPIYAAIALFLLGVAVGSGHERNLVWGLPLFAAGTWLRVREEERLLRASFGPVYAQYALRVRRFVPGLI